MDKAFYVITLNDERGHSTMIKGKLINLRTMRQEDIDEIFCLTSDLSQRGEYWDVRLSSEPSFKKRFQETGCWNDTFGTMIITNKEGRLLGEISYFKGVWYLPGYEVGYRIYRDEDKGKGYTSEALRLFTAYLFELKPIKRLEIQVSVGNIPSRKVAEKVGFKYEGLKRQAVFSKGKYEDIELFSLLREECLSLSEVL
ncbi:GNAT family N-acetyltransferase [Oceanirhabdus sp. W0125-5]|uniref:GNAT family N-acetyltransferase n=1 Tax=Oceanirhabdus sp. W0125-5 TaxID=2999116 RepID=UPI0022F2ABFE|nr:GNAT family protein [Oceanirhabdus sp. W0125-5]WBW94936.1 GNAT family protein [Oceanirhabdus sp. W0125-5]